MREREYTKQLYKVTFCRVDSDKEEEIFSVGDNLDDGLRRFISHYSFNQYKVIGIIYLGKTIPLI